MILGEDILIGTWLNGERLEDLEYVNPSLFEHVEVVRDLKAGMPTLQIYSKHTKIRRELVEFSINTFPALYESAYKSLIEEQVRRELKGQADLKKVRELLDYLDSAFAEHVASYKDYASSFTKEIERRSHQELIKWESMPTLQDISVGIKRKELTTIAARPSVGKSAFALQVAYGAWKQGAKVLYFPLEMSAVQTFGRILVREGCLTPKEFQTGSVRDEEKLQQGEMLLNELEQSKRFLIYEGEGRIENIEKLIEEEKPYMIVIDQLTQMKASVQFKDIRSQFSYMTSNLKRIAMQYDVAVLLLCQINRNADNIRPTMANLKESGSIEEDSDNVLLLHRFKPGDDEDVDNSSVDWDNERPMEFNLAKQRDGETGQFGVIFRPAQMRFFEPYMGGAI